MKYHFAKVDDKLMGTYIRMVQKIYPDFNSDTQYCFWMVPDFWDKMLLYDVVGSVSVLDGGNHEICCVNLPAKAVQLTRTPYYNKGIRQVGLKLGRTRCFGIPFVFDTLEELQQIRCVKIHWDIMKPMFLSDTDVRPLDIRMTTLDTVYYIDFDVANVGDNHWFTLAYQDKFFDMSEKYRQELTHYYENVICLSGIQVADALSHGYDVDDFMMKIFTGDNVEGDLSDRESEIVDDLLKRDILYLVDMVHECEKSHGMRLSNQWDLDKYYYERSIRLFADPYPDIIPESGFGL